MKTRIFPNVWTELICSELKVYQTTHSLNAQLKSCTAENIETTYEVELVVEPGPSLSDGGSVGEHANSTVDLGEVSSGNGCWRLNKKTSLKLNGILNN